MLNLQAGSSSSKIYRGMDKCGKDREFHIDIPEPNPQIQHIVNY